MALRVIHVGVGGRGVWPLELAAAADDWESVALVDISERSLTAARERTGLPESACFADLTEAAKAVEADAAIICTPTLTHASACRAAFEAGLHTLVEKGMTNSLAEARALVDAADQAGVCFCVAQNYRYAASHLSLKAALQSGDYGQPAFFDHVHHRRRIEPRTLDYPASVLWDMACHHLDLFVDWFGPVARVNGRLFDAPWSKYRDPAGAVGWLEFASGARGHYELTHLGQRNWQHLEIHTDRGVLLKYSVGGIEFLPDGQDTAAEAVPLLDAPPSEQGVLDAFGAYIREGLEPGISGRQNLRVLSIIAAMIASDQQHGAVVAIDSLEDTGGPLHSGA